MFTQDVCFLPESGRFHCAVHESAYDPLAAKGTLLAGWTRFSITFIFNAASQA